MVYTQTDLENGINRGIHNRWTNLIDGQALMNEAVRLVIGEIDLKMTVRQTQVSPGIYDDEYNYMCPVDMKNEAIIDVARQAGRREEFTLTTQEEFDRRKMVYKGLIAFSGHDGLRILSIATQLQTNSLILDTLQSPTSDGTWVASGQAGNLSQDFSNFVYGSSSLRFDVSSGGTTAILTNSTLTPVDLTDYTNNELFIFVYIPDTTNLTSFTLKWGDDASNYWSATATTTHEGLSFYTGWNLIRFPWPATSTGSPAVTSVNYAQLTVTLSGSNASTGWRLNLLVARIGDIHNIIYYSKYGWQTSAGTYIENSTTSTDKLNADTDEVDLFVMKGIVLAAQELRFPKQEKDDAKADYERAKQNYIMRYPSRRKILTTTYHDFGSIDQDDMSDIEPPVSRRVTP